MLTIRKIHDGVTSDLARIKRELAALSSMKIYVGIQDDASDEALMIATINEYGLTIKMTDKMRRYLGATGLFDSEKDYTPIAGHQTGYINIPERSFIRASFDTGIRQMNKPVEQLVREVLRGDRTAKQAADVIGAILVEISEYAKKQRVTTTIEPLFDTGAFIVNRITYRIKEQ